MGIGQTGHWPNRALGIGQTGHWALGIANWALAKQGIANLLVLLPITDYRLPITDSPFPIPHSPFPIPHFQILFLFFRNNF
ncbi:MAG: hypothetical protein EAZ78_20710 [Oscillatoriales cyanobacterium]|nr:MAG: hypothetical protein EAZ98_22305 [Oscillatoriales cyanobacterium]TAE03173.1 MAG: hypothetical protein EAZ96_13740 [Oscillatoriales cyanobacterium]TAF00202.1 MAG: hypothetical protein EAZ78_20710 [Oscillatoriales cyanobacterium]TAF35882.1 MAG: hypothetical protein EAZ68_17855 [Oscillatoriales cyanobacterium]TAF62520.1 MAG: hypothetical protein EAZ59_23760 [Oscillatoriales cyanobacterium]